MRNIFNIVSGILVDSAISLIPKDKRKAFLTGTVQKHWPGLPSFSTLKTPKIQEVETASVGSGVVLTWKKDGVRKVMLGKAGPHYEFEHQKRRKDTPFPDCYTIPGGFITLTHTDGSSLVPASDKPETGYTGAAREVEEEFTAAGGGPLFKVDPKRLKPMDTESMAFPNGNKMVVLGMMMELNEEEIEIAEAHAQKMAQDQEYKDAVQSGTINKDTSLAEISDVEIFDLDDVVAGKVPLLHQDQQSLFLAVQTHFNDIESPKKRTGPTLAYKDKVKTLPELKKQVEEWRANGNAAIGITSGVFDLLHPGHFSFLHDCSSEAGRLIVIVASDRTVKEQKGEAKPIFSEIHRAQSLASLSDVDVIIISDSYYHEDILEALKPDIMFKGEDYAGKEIFGSQYVNRVAIIPCAEDKYFHSSEVIKEIWSKKPAPAL